MLMTVVCLYIANFVTLLSLFLAFSVSVPSFSDCRGRVKITSVHLWICGHTECFAQLLFSQFGDVICQCLGVFFYILSFEVFQTKHFSVNSCLAFCICDQTVITFLANNTSSGLCSICVYAVHGLCNGMVSVLLSHLPAAAVCSGFAALGPACRRSPSIAAQLAPQQHGAAAQHATANAGSATFTADVGS